MELVKWTCSNFWTSIAMIKSVPIFLVDTVMQITHSWMFVFFFFFSDQILYIFLSYSNWPKVIVKLKFSIDLLAFLHENICCGYSSEAPH